MKKTWLTVLFVITYGVLPIVLMCRDAIAQDASTTPTESPATSLTGTTPATNSFENSGNGIQQINGNFNGTLTTPACTSRVCPFAIGRITPNGSELIIGIIANLGGSADEDRAAAEKLRIEMEGVKNNNDYKLQLLDKLSTAIDSGNSLRIRAIAIAIAPILGYSDFRQYLKALLNEPS